MGILYFSQGYINLTFFLFELWGLLIFKNFEYIMNFNLIKQAEKYYYYIIII